MRRTTFTISLPTPLVLAALMGAAFFAGMMAVRAMGGSFSETDAANTLTFAGTITGPSPPFTLTFSFFKDGATQPACAIDATVTKLDKDGGFTAPLKLAGTSCARDKVQLFEGGNVTYTIKIDGKELDLPPTLLNTIPYASFAERYGSPDCPVGYVKDPNPPNSMNPDSILCKKGADEVVKVGTGATAFWIDRYEASVWSKSGGGGIQYGKAGDDYPASFLKNGQRTDGFVDLFAVSRSDVAPSGSNSWFQAQQACRASGKRLPTDEEWLAAASGTPDPPMDNDGSKGGECVTRSAGHRATGGAGGGSKTNCVSAWGAQDMVGNIWEWTQEWHTGAGDGIGRGYINQGVTNWPPAYNGDGTWGVNTWVDTGAGFTTGVPGGTFRGGAYNDGTKSGVFAMIVGTGPSYANVDVGFRCVIPR